MSAKTILKLMILSVFFVTAQAYAESGGAPFRLAMKILTGIAADTRTLARHRASRRQDPAERFPGLGVIGILLLTGIYGASWSPAN